MKSLDDLKPKSSKTSEVVLTPSESFRINHYLPIIDTLMSTLDEKISAYETAVSYFGFLSNLESLSPEEITSITKILVKIYAVDGLTPELEGEIIQFRELCKLLLVKEKGMSLEMSMLKWIVAKRLDCFPNIEMTLRIYLTLMISNYSGERSFSKMKRIKNKSRTSMAQSRLNSLIIISLEHDVFKEINFEDVIETFARSKTRKGFLG